MAVFTMGIAFPFQCRFYNTPGFFGFLDDDIAFMLVPPRFIWRIINGNQIMIVMTVDIIIALSSIEIPP